MKIYLVQYDPTWENKEENKDKLYKALLSKSPDNGIIIFPEMTLTGFTMNGTPHAEQIPGDSSEYFSKLAETYNCHVFAGIIENEQGCLFNSLVHINPAGDILAKYRKIHPFTYSGEDKNYCAGNVPVITQVEDMKIGLSICYDLRFPELFRKYAKEKVEMIINIANWPYQRIEHWKALIKARAIENQCYFAGVNRIGMDPAGYTYNGCSALLGPLGEDVIPFEQNEGVFVVDIQKSNVEKIRAKLPFLNDIKMI